MVVTAVWPTNHKAYTVEFLQGKIAQVTQASVATPTGPNTVYNQVIGTCIMQCVYRLQAQSPGESALLPGGA
jgi:hypothetical protein